MKIDFVTISDQQPGRIATLLRASYAHLLKLEPRWASENKKWEEYDRQVFAHPGAVGARIFFTRLDGHVVGFGSWDPRQGPEYGIVGHNCILPEFRGKGLGKLQIQEILRRFQIHGIKTAKASTGDHPFFIPAQRMYLACGFREVRRTARKTGFGLKIVEYERDLGQRRRECF